jgi:hypothetical protein
MNSTNLPRRDMPIAVRFPAIVREAIEIAAGRNYLSISDVIRRATIDRLRSDGLLTDDQTRPASRSGPY